MNRTKMLITKVIFAIAAGYVIIVAVIAMSQTSVIFPTGMADAQAPVLPADAIRLEVKTSGGERLVGTHFRPRGGDQADRLMVLGFGGNAANADGLALYLRALFPVAFRQERQVLAVGAPPGPPGGAALGGHGHRLAAGGRDHPEPRF